MWLNATKSFEGFGELPKFQRVQQTFPRPRVLDIVTAVNEAVDSLGFSLADLQNRKVAITAGSRGISEITTILAALVGTLQKHGAKPFIVPAMGSHGGGTAEGQRRMLAELGMTEESLGAEIISSLETIELGKLPNGMPVYIDKVAFESDAIAVVNRVKPHTDFVGDYESGLAKMVSIGLGKLHGAQTLHQYGVLGLQKLMPEAARFICKKAPVLFGLAIIENAYHEVAQIAALPSEQIAGQRELELLKKAYQFMPSFPFAEIDVLIIDEIGKNISGVGMDPKIIGRAKVHSVPDLASCSIRTIVVLQLTHEAHGNASGIGLADITTQRLVQHIDFEATYLNCITSGITGIQRAALPLIAPNDKAAIQTAIRVCGSPKIQETRIARIKNTLSLGVMDVSIGLLKEAPPGSLTLLDETDNPLAFDQDGSLAPLSPALMVNQKPVDFRDLN